MNTKESIWLRISYWFKDRWRRIDIFDETLALSRRRNPVYYIGSLLYISLVFQILIGAILAIYYVPTFDGAYKSITYITEQLMLFGFPIGFWLRNLHRYLADAVIILAMLRVFRFFFTADFKKPHELSWITSIIFLLFSTVFGFSGYVLPLDQRAFWATTIGTAFPLAIDQMPLIGNLRIGSLFSFIARGGTVLNQNTLTRFYALHYIFPLLILIFVEIFYYFKNKRRINIPVLGIIIFAIIILFIGKIFPATSEAAATPDSPPAHILPDWYFLFVYYLLKIMPLLIGILFNFGFIIFVALMPWIETNTYKDYRKRPLWILLGALGILLFLVLSYRSFKISDTVVLKRDIPYIILSYFIIIVIGGFMQWRVKINERKKHKLVEQK
jgi:quinol-cytochrome oxidoreductase complex cytochrome b subunit